MTCSVCKEYENQVTQLSANGRLPMASGIRVDGKERLKFVVDHLMSRAHEEAKRLKTHDELWTISRLSIHGLECLKSARKTLSKFYTGWLWMHIMTVEQRH